MVHIDKFINEQNIAEFTNIFVKDLLTKWEAARPLYSEPDPTIIKEFPVIWEGSSLTKKFPTLEGRRVVRLLRHDNGDISVQWINHFGAEKATGIRGQFSEQQALGRLSAYLHETDRKEDSMGYYGFKPGAELSKIMWYTYNGMFRHKGLKSVEYDNPLLGKRTRVEHKFEYVLDKGMRHTVSYYLDGEMKSIAVCNPIDEYSFARGAAVAITKSVKSPEPSETYMRNLVASFNSLLSPKYSATYNVKVENYV